MLSYSSPLYILEIGLQFDKFLNGQVFNRSELFSTIARASPYRAFSDLGLIGQEVAILRAPRSWT